MIKIFAADIATETGAAVDGPNGKPRFITKRLKAGGEDLGAAGLDFAEWLHGMLSMEKPDFLVIEAPVLGNSGGKVFTSELLIGLCFTAAVVAKSLNIPLKRAHVQQVRRHFLGSGRPPNPKRAVMDRCRLFGWAPRNHNEGDAAALWAYQKAVLDPSFRLEAATPLFGRPAGIPA